MNLQTRVERLEQSMSGAAFDFSAISDEELTTLESLMSRHVAGDVLHAEERAMVDALMGKCRRA